ncbi:MAG: LysR family transcriptional regulator [Zoogloea sp.]|uniref:LysR family transcriptional regulator n=1 Tax=Zoogloea sp. TaxID=49181 RepID=UPI002624F6F7|nr:LysR family transcriptional regulator [Zoogloea sp.]MDD3325700.1 LysR family transcriptional regulator [Zoogloea sp.]
MNLNQLRHLIALAEHHSFSKAADVLCLTQPALSRSIQTLEQELDVKLIDRDSKRNTLTAYGALVAERAERILLEARELKRGVELLKEGQLGELNVGFGPTPAAVLMQPFLTHMASRYPRMQLRIARGSVELLVQSLRNESVDVIAVDRRALPTADDLAIGPVTTLRGGFLCRSGHPLTQLAQIDLAALRQFPVASTPLSDELARLLVEQLGPDAHPARLVTVNSEDITSLLDLVESTDTVFFGIFACARARIAAGRVCEIHVEPHFERVGEYALVSLARRSTSPAAEAFRGFFAENFGE